MRRKKIDDSERRARNSLSNLYVRNDRSASDAVPSSGTPSAPPPLAGLVPNPSASSGYRYPTLDDIFPSEGEVGEDGRDTEDRGSLPVPKKPSAREQSHLSPRAASSKLPPHRLGAISTNRFQPTPGNDPPGEKQEAPSTISLSSSAHGPNHLRRSNLTEAQPPPNSGAANHQSSFAMQTGVTLGKPSKKGSLEDDDIDADATHEAFHMPQVGPSAPSPFMDANADHDDDESMDQVPPIQFHPHARRNLSLKNSPDTNSQSGRGELLTPRTSATQGAVNASSSSGQPHTSIPDEASAIDSSRQKGLHGSKRTPQPSINSSSNSSRSDNLLSTQMGENDSPMHSPNESFATKKVNDVSRVTSSSTASSSDSFEQDQLRLATEASMKDTGQNGGNSEPLSEEWLDRAKENACSLQDICRQEHGTDVDPDFLEHYLSTCVQDQTRIKHSSIESIDIAIVDKVFVVNDILLAAIEEGNSFKDELPRKPAPSRIESPVIASLVAKKDIFSLICMLRAQQDDQRLGAALALMRFAEKAETEGASQEDRRYRNEILSSGGLHSLLTLFRSRSSIFELKVVVALAIAYILPSFVATSSNLIKPGLGLKIMECLRFLSQSRDISPLGERITRQKSFKAAAIGLVTFWYNQLEPMLKAQSNNGIEYTAYSDTVGRRPSIGHRRGRSIPGHVFDQRKEAIGMQELVEMTVSLIIEFASQDISETKGSDIDPVLLVEQMCAVEVARPIAVREGILKILVGWIERGRKGRKRLAAVTSLRFLTSIKDKYMAGWIHSQMVNEGALPAIVQLTRDESLGPQVRLDVAQILSSLCVAPHTRAAVVEADCIHFLVDILYEHGTSEEVALFASQALLQLAVGAITRASVLGGDGLQSPTFTAPDKRDKVVE
jgi:hypothetical protein